MSVSRRLIFSVGFLMLLSVGAVGSQLLFIRQMQEVTSGLNTVSFKAAEALLEMQGIATRLDGLTEKFLTVGDAFRGEYEPLVDQNVRAFDERFKLLMNILGPKQAPDEIALLFTSWTEYRSLLEKWRHVPTARGLDEMPLEMSTALDLLQQRTESSQTAVVSSMAREVARNEMLGKQAQSIAYTAAALFLLSGGLLTFLTVRAINRPLRELTRGTRKIASGEFTHRLPGERPLRIQRARERFQCDEREVG
jgi:HAMP domain-containing protein